MVRRRLPSHLPARRLPLLVQDSVARVVVIVNSRAVRGRHTDQDETRRLKLRIGRPIDVRGPTPPQ